MGYGYPYVAVAQPEGGWTVTFPDVPEAITEGDSADEAAAMAEDALVSALSFYVEDGRALPAPSLHLSGPIATVPPLATAKLALHEAMLAANVTDAVLGARLGRDRRAISRLRDPLADSAIGEIEAALRALGTRVEGRVPQPIPADAPAARKSSG